MISIEAMALHLRVNGGVINDAWGLLRLRDNTCVPNGVVGSISAGYWNDSIYDANSEAYFTIVNIGDDTAENMFAILLRLKDVGGTNTEDGYIVDWQNNTLRVRKITDDNRVQVGSTVARTLQNGYKFGVRISGTDTTTIEIFTEEGAGWVLRHTVQDTSSPFTNSGYIGAWIYRGNGDSGNQAIDDFGGGNSEGGGCNTVVIMEVNTVVSINTVVQVN